MRDLILQLSKSSIYSTKPQKGTIIVSTEEIFDGNNKEHIGKANDIEIKLLDLGLLPLMTEL
ncbi:immunity 52 family protein [Klebsiella pneumoniae]|nr:immunity 52 family protein [Klebsiella pneumoniae]